MNIVAHFSVAELLIAFVFTFLILLYFGRIGIVRNVFDPLILMHLQLVFTVVLLGWSGLLPVEQVFYLLCVYAWMAWQWKGAFSGGISECVGWKYCVILLVLISIPANLYLLLTKGFILFQEDVGAAKVEFYQGVGIVRRINTALAVILPVHVFVKWHLERAWSRWLSVGLLYSIFIILSLGSKAGVALLAFSYGSVLYFSDVRQNKATLIVVFLLSIISSLFMFFLVYGSGFLIDLGIRVVAFADGPFYYFKEGMSIDVPFAYPFYIFAYAARLIEALPVTSLGPEINWRFFGLNDELYGPNPQIFVESVAIFGPAAFFYYIVFGLIIFLFAKYARNPYSFAVWITFLRPFPGDSQLAFSNLYTIFFVLMLYVAAGFIVRLLKNASRSLMVA